MPIDPVFDVLIGTYITHASRKSLDAHTETQVSLEFITLRPHLGESVMSWLTYVVVV